MIEVKLYAVSTFVAEVEPLITEDSTLSSDLVFYASPEDSAGF
jgi:hypothetical protein